MPKFFCVSDIHSFYTELIKALDVAGFDKNNPEHYLIVCGDCFDRGPNTLEVLHYLQSLKNKFLIKGNHEILLMDCIKRGYPLSHDYANGTWQSVIDLAPEAQTQISGCEIANERVKDFIENMYDYFETKNYIFVHSWIPLICEDNLPDHYINNRKFKFDENWREAHNRAWERARWGNPFDLAKKNFLPDKTIVFGHFHTSYPRYKYENKPEFGTNADFSIYYGEGYIGIDACTAYSKKVNVLVLEDEFID